MAVITGQAGTVTLSGATALNVKSWEFTAEQKIEETTHAGSGGYQANVPTYKAGSGTFELDYDSTVTFPTWGSAITLTLLAGNTLTKTVVCTGIVNSIPTKNDARGLVTLTFEFTTTSSFTINL